MPEARLSFDEAGGSGRPIVLVHGWCGNRSHMRALAQHLASTHRVFSVDLPGHGTTPLGDVAPTFDGLAGGLAEFCRWRDLRDAVLVGHSMGGVVAVHVAGSCADRIAAVVNLDGALPPHAEGRAAYAALSREVSERGFRRAIEPFVRNAYFLPREAGPQADALVSAMLAAPNEVAEALLAQFPGLDAAPVLAACRAPLLYVGSSRPRFDSAAVERLRPETWVARVAVSGHFVQVFALAQVVAMIEKFVAGIPAPARPAQEAFTRPPDHRRPR
ncbi:MAG TPA: alpha/beta fold hydrolase [Candidatus Binatia bacterium]|nr:alpha/beta fold hydrolase [Candidatus Binatia bacterium]